MGLRFKKIDAALVQLDTACRMFFTPLEVDRVDLASVYTLASATHEVLEDLAKRLPGRPMSLRRKLDELPDQKAAGAIAHRLRHPQNFLKHANRDPDGQLVLTYPMVERKLALAVTLANDACFPLTRVMHGVLAIYFVQYGQAAKDSPDLYVVFRRGSVPREAERSFIRRVIAGKALTGCVEPLVPVMPAGRYSNGNTSPAGSVE